MSSELRVNASLFSDNGVIGRCDYLLKTIYLNIILSFFALPMNFWIFTNMSQLSDGLSIGSLALSAPIYIHVFYIIYTFFIGVSIHKMYILMHYFEQKIL